MRQCANCYYFNSYPRSSNKRKRPEWLVDWAASQRKRSIKNMVQFGEESASRLESSRIRVRGLSEFLYLYKKVENSRKPKLQATSRRFLCPAYRARASLSSRFCSVHYVLVDGWNSGANTHTGYLYRDDFLVACVAATQRTDKSELLTRTK